MNVFRCADVNLAAYLLYCKNVPDIQLAGGGEKILFIFPVNPESEYNPKAAAKLFYQNQATVNPFAYAKCLKFVRKQIIEKLRGIKRGDSQQEPKCVKESIPITSAPSLNLG
jgi:hypothetical protein